MGVVTVRGTLRRAAAAVAPRGTTPDDGTREVRDRDPAPGLPGRTARGGTRGPVAVRVRTATTLLALTAALPVSAALTGAAALIGAVRRRRSGPSTSDPAGTGAPSPPPDRRTIMISGGKMTKALALARAFHRAGHRVVLVEQHRYRFSGHRFSRAVDAFHVVPAPDAPDYATRLAAVARAEGVDVYVPVCSPLASWYDADAARVLEPFCEVVHPDADVVAMLDDKQRFTATAASMGLSVPAAHRITDPRQVIDFDFPPGRSWIMKSIAYDPVRRMDLTRLPRPTPVETAAFVRDLPISPDNPWILQEFVEGTEYCTHSTVRDGRVRLHCCCPSSSFQLTYTMVDHPVIEDWVRRFCGEHGVTGQLSFDFIEDAAGRVYAIECNPRTHSAITMFYDHPGVAAAYLEGGHGTVLPTPRSRPTYWLHHELGRLLRNPGTLPDVARTVWRGKEALLESSDPLPFLLVPHLQITSLLLGNLRRGRDWVKIDVNIGKLVEPAGD
ncbi:ATP-grasp enzyme [Pseudonocardia nematodicida]|uniref:ATP-grasp enzyme n=1 Tax=Pseudonocardia nematodicida TaxID=1206997 RepID=A0ABV1KIY2_9PSEU